MTLTSLPNSPNGDVSNCLAFLALDVERNTKATDVDLKQQRFLSLARAVTGFEVSRRVMDNSLVNGTSPNKSAQSEGTEISGNEVQFVKFIPKAKPQDGYEGIFPWKVERKSDSSIDTDDSKCLDITTMTPTFDVNIDRYAGSTLSKLEDHTVVSDRSADAGERRLEQSKTIEEETLLEAPRGAWEPKRCAVVDRALQLRKRRLPNKHYKKGWSLSGTGA